MSNRTNVMICISLPQAVTFDTCRSLRKRLAYTSLKQGVMLTMFIDKKVLGCIGFMLSSCVAAEQWQLEVGGGAFYQSSLFTGVDGSLLGLPYINAQYGRWSLGMQHGIFRYRLFDKDSSFQAWVGLGVRDETYDGLFMSDSDLSDDKVFDGYKPGDTDFTYTVSAQWHDLALSFEQDFSEHSEGYVADVNYQFIDFPITQRFFVKAKVGARYYDQNYVDYVYGVSETNVDMRVGRHYFEGEAATNGYANVDLIYAFNKQWTLISSAKAESIADEIANSPLVDEDVSYSVMLLLTYKGL